MKTLLGLAILVLDIMAIVDCAKGTWSGGKKFLWILLILVLPLIGMVLYFLVAKKKAA